MMHSPPRHDDPTRLRQELIPAMRTIRLASQWLCQELASGRPVNQARLAPVLDHLAYEGRQVSRLVGLAERRLLDATD